MKYEIESKFHNTSMITSIKDCYKDDPLCLLDYEIYNKGSGLTYARRKLAQIKKALCGQPDCKCVFSIVERKIK